MMLAPRGNIYLRSSDGCASLGGMTPTETMKRYFETWLQHDFDALQALFADDMTFRGPLGSADGAVECRHGLEGMATRMSSLEIKAMTDNGPDVITWFELQTTDASPIPVANWARVEGGKIQQVRVSFDPRPLL
jgi:hypothetical protein